MKLAHTVFTLALLGVFILATAVSADVPTVMNYQGKLTDAAGDPVADGPHNVVFKIYDGASEEKWSESHTVQTTDGLFSVQLGSNGSPLTEALFSSPERYLGIKVGSDPEMTPWTRIASAPFAFKSWSTDYAGFAYNADSLGGAAAGDYATAEHNHDLGELSDVNTVDIEVSQIIKWNGTAWVAADDEIGGGDGGWVDDGNVVRLETITDLVGIGTANPSAKLDVSGDIRSTGTIYGTVDNADKVDGKHNGQLSADIWDGHHWGNLYPDADKLDGYDASYFTPLSQFSSHSSNPSVHHAPVTSVNGLSGGTITSSVYVNGLARVQGVSGGGPLFKAENNSTASYSSGLYAWGHSFGVYGEGIYCSPLVTRWS